MRCNVCYDAVHLSCSGMALQRQPQSYTCSSCSNTTSSSRCPQPTEHLSSPRKQKDSRRADSSRCLASSPCRSSTPVRGSKCSAVSPARRKKEDVKKRLCVADESNSHDDQLMEVSEDNDRPSRSRELSDSGRGRGRRGGGATGKRRGGGQQPRVSRSSSHETPEKTPLSRKSSRLTEPQDTPKVDSSDRRSRACPKKLTEGRDSSRETRTSSRETRTGSREALELRTPREEGKGRGGTPAASRGTAGRGRKAGGRAAGTPASPANKLPASPDQSPSRSR